MPKAKGLDFDALRIFATRRGYSLWRADGSDDYDLMDERLASPDNGYFVLVLKHRLLVEIESYLRLPETQRR